MGMRLIILPGLLGIAKLSPMEAIPLWATEGGFFSVTRTPHELSIVTLEENLPATVNANKGWRMFQIQGPIELSEIGVLNSLTAPLAHAGISIFAISTFDTDYLLVKEESLKRATQTLQDAGHSIASSVGS